MAVENAKHLDKIDLTGEEPIVTTEVVKKICIDLIDDDDNEEEENEEIDENVPPVKKVKPVNKNCEICEHILFKYTCPGCSMKTCSLDCVMEHKKTTGCSGQRNKTSFVARTEFDNIHLLNDYRLLEEVARIADNAKRDTKAKKPWVQKRITILQKHSQKAGVSWYAMEKGMKRAKENRTRYIFKEESIQWTIKLVFVDIEKEFFEQCFDRDILKTVLQKYINKEKILPEYKIPFSQYIQDEALKVSVFFRNEFEPGDNSRYTLVDHEKPLKDCLHGKSVLEYPEFHIALEESVKDLAAEEFVKEKEEDVAPQPLDSWLLLDQA